MIRARIAPRHAVRRSGQTHLTVRLLAAVAPMACIATALAAQACSSDAGTAVTSPPPAYASHPQSHAIHVVVKHADGTTDLLKLGPATEAHFGNAGGAAAVRFDFDASGGSASQGTPGLRFLGVNDEGGTPVAPPPSVDNPETNPWSTAWALVARAAEDCEYPLATTDNVIEIPPWRTTDTSSTPIAPWFVYPGWSIRSCADRLALQQNSLCVADKLAAIADAVGTIVWPGRSPAVTYGAADGGSLGALDVDEWDIPPQSDADRFIVRDLAIHTLAMIPTADAYTDITFPSPLPQHATCAQAFASLAGSNDTACVSDPVGEAVFGMRSSIHLAPAFPPSDVPLCDPAGHNNAPAIARTALEIEAQILRGSGRLLHDAIRRDVYSDLAAAARSSAQTLDPVLGEQVAWGVSDQGQYGSIAHAARVLAGRWEIGDKADFGNVADPQCESTRAIDLLPKAFGNVLTARVLDRSIRTPGEQTAAQLVERSGIVVPACKLGDPSLLSKALIAQLLVQEKNTNGVAPPDAAIKSIVQALSPEELTFAFERALRTWRLATDSPDPTEGAVPTQDAGASVCAPVAQGTGPKGTVLPAGLSLATDAAGNPAVVQAVTDVLGIAVKGGLGRSRLKADPIARSAGMMEASQCDESSPYWSVWGLDGTAIQANNPNVTNGVAQPPGAALPAVVFQDAFHVGQAIERRLNLLQQAVAGQTEGNAGAVARGGIAELRNWAGATIVQAWPVGTVSAGNPTVSTFTVRVGGMSYGSDFGLPDQPDATGMKVVASSFGFVYGDPWMAECAAHVRADCPDQFDQTYVQVASEAVDVANDPQNAGAGVLDNLFELHVNISNGGNFNPPYSGPQNPQTSHLYMVRLHEPKDPLGRGRVLGTLPLSGSWTREILGGNVDWFWNPAVVGFVDAPMQRELLHDAIDLGKWVGAKPPALGDPSAAQTAGYCVDGVPRDLFVPLDNELISGNATYEDSWEHYLDLAQQAAQTADTLGQQLIADDLQISERQQAAQEQLANICGDFGALSNATVASDGRISGGLDEKTTNECLSEPLIDVVFLGDLPAGISEDGDQTCAIKAAIHCDTSYMSGCSQTQSPGSKMPPSALSLCKKTTLTAAALHVAVPPPAPAGTPSSCEDIVGAVATTIMGGFSAMRFQKDLQGAELSPSRMQDVLSELKMVVGFDGSWTLGYGHQTLMDSTNVQYWPACLASGCSALTDDQKKLADAWSATFRSCPQPLNDTLDMPLGCAGGGAAAELNMIRWRVIQALWMMGVSAGTVPQGMVTQPIPGIFGDDWVNPPYGTVFPLGVQAYYLGTTTQAPSTAWCAGSSPCFMLSPDDRVAGTSIADSDALHGLAPVSGAFKAFEGGAPYELPYWYRELYSPDLNNVVLHTMQANDAVTIDQCVPGSPFSPAPSPGFGEKCSDPPLPTPSPLFSLVGRASKLDGIQCTTKFGEAFRDPAWDAEAGQPWWVTVEEVKLGSPRLWTTPTGGNISRLDRGADAYNWDISQSATAAPGSLATNWGPAVGVPALPSHVPPSLRAVAYSGWGASPNGTCGATALLLGASVLACTPKFMSGPDEVSLDGVPPITSLDDVTHLTQWLASAQAQLTNLTGQFYVQEVPARVVRDFTNGTVGSGNLGGTKGQAVLAMEQQLQAFPSEWRQIANDVGSIRDAIQVADIAIRNAKLDEQTTEASIALQTIEVQAQMATSIQQLMSETVRDVSQADTSLGVSLIGVPAAVMSTMTVMSFSGQELAQLRTMSSNADQAEKNALALALVQLNQATVPLWTDIQKQLDNLRGDVAQVDMSGQSILQAEHQAAYQGAIGTGADFVNIAGQEVPIPVNTVLRRQASATEQRYQEALTNAKALAYMARRAIEQRIGARLDAFTRQVGPLEAPATWADDICSLQGVNYASLSSAVPAVGADGAAIDGGGMGASVDKEAISQFADAWVGDYVAKLRNFVTYYNAQYPSHQGQDTAVLSLRYDLLAPAVQCTVQGPNVLTNSGELSRTASGSWQVTPCDPTVGKCVAVVGGYALPSDHEGPFGKQGPDGNDATGISWLVDVSGATGVVDGGVGSDGGPEGGIVVSGSGPNWVAQVVNLPAGSYVLSWWDQARQLDGSLAWAGGASLPPPYVVRVMDAGGNAVATFDDSAYSPPRVGDGGVPPSYWSPRRTLSFTVTKAGPYSVAFAPSEPGGPLGSVAIAAVQLEQAVDGQPTEYVETNESTMVDGANCPLSDAELRAAFARNCDARGACYFDLTVPLVIDTTDIGAGSALGAKLASGNYNYRHITAAVNLVGTGIHDCSKTPNPNCYGTGYIQYDLQHDASNAGIVGFDGNARIFDFGAATINHGKALAAERYLTMPLSSSDQALISQPGIQHVELGGRPLDGTYHLRIWDSPDLNWSALKDVQIIVNYEYWSAIGMSQSQAKVRATERARTPFILGRRAVPSR